MDYCAALKGWKDLSPSERYEVMKELTERAANEFGLGPLNYENRGQPDNPETDFDESRAASWYDPATNTVGFNPAALGQESAEESLSHAGHEFAHATFDQLFPEEDAESAADSEWAADTFGDSYADDIADTCDDPPQESPFEDDVPDPNDDGDDGDDGDEGVEEGSDDPRRPPWTMPDEEKDAQDGGTDG